MSWTAFHPLTRIAIVLCVIFAGASLAGWDREALEVAGPPFAGGEDEGRIPLS
jgi:hypothetical protein